MPYNNIKELLHNRTNFTDKQNIICDYVLENAESISLMTAKELALNAGVGEATLFRFLKEVGYDNFSDFKSDIHNYSINSEKASYWQMKAMLESSQDISDNEVLFSTISKSLNLLEKSIDIDIIKDFHAAANMILDSPTTGVLGLRSSKAMALYFEYLLIPFFTKVQQLSHDEHFIFDRIKQFEPGSVLFIITTYPNTLKTIKAAKFCHDLGYRIVLLTNSISCPILSYADISLIMPKSKEVFTIIPLIAMLESLANEIGRKLAPDSTNKLDELDDILTKYNIINKK